MKTNRESPFYVIGKLKEIQEEKIMYTLHVLHLQMSTQIAGRETEATRNYKQLFFATNE